MEGRKTSTFVVGILVIISILIIIGILVYLLTSFYFGYWFLMLFLLCQLLILFLKIFFFIFVIFVGCNSFFNFDTIILVQNSRSWAKSPICIKLGIKSIVF